MRPLFRQSFCFETVCLRPFQITGNSDVEHRAPVTASVPGESNRPAVSRGVKPRAGKSAFPRSARLLRHADFERVYKQGRRHFSASMTVFYWQRPKAGSDAAQPQISGAPSGKVSVVKPVAPGLRIGFTVSRALGGAVQRNRMKRRLREAVRLTWPRAGPNADVVINPKKSLLTVDFAAIVNEVSRAFVVIEQKLAGPERGSGSRKPGA